MTTEHPVQGEVSDERFAELAHEHADATLARGREVISYEFTPQQLRDFVRSLLASGVPAGEPIQHHPVNPAVGDSLSALRAAPRSQPCETHRHELPAPLCPACGEGELHPVFYVAQLEGLEFLQRKKECDRCGADLFGDEELAFNSQRFDPPEASLEEVAAWICQDDEKTLGPKCCGMTVTAPCNGCPHAAPTPGEPS